MELEIFVHHCLDIEADGGDGGDHLSSLESVQDGRLAGTVKTKDKDSHLLRANQVSEVAEQTSHDDISLASLLALVYKIN